jgi:hypothetical protein
MKLTGQCVPTTASRRPHDTVPEQRKELSLNDHERYRNENNNDNKEGDTHVHRSDWQCRRMGKRNEITYLVPGTKTANCASCAEIKAMRTLSPTH